MNSPEWDWEEARSQLRSCLLSEGSPHPKAASDVEEEPAPRRGPGVQPPSEVTSASVVAQERTELRVRALGLKTQGCNHVTWDRPPSSL